MNKQRKVLITITYNEMGVIIDTKAEEVAQPDLQPTCNQLATDCISRQAAIDAVIAEGRDVESHYLESERIIHEADAVEAISMLPSAEPKKGRWILRHEEVKKEMFTYFILHLYCSECGAEYNPHTTMLINFCPNCGSYNGGADEV